MNRLAAAALMWGSVILGACSAEPLRPSSDGSADASTLLDDGGVDRCNGSISDVSGRCPASFDGSVADLPACPGLSQTVQLCGDVIALGQGGGFTSLTCYFDATTHVLVGALEVSDSPQFCEGGSFARFNGQVPGASCDTTTPSFVVSCSKDGSAD